MDVVTGKNRIRRRVAGTDGFTLIELLTVIVYMGILMMIATNMVDRRAGVYLATIQADLRTATSEQEGYYFDNFTYAPTQDSLQFGTSAMVTLEVQGTPAGYTMRTTHAMLNSARCAIFIGYIDPIFEPAVQEGLIECEGGGRGGMGGGGQGCRNKSEQGKEKGQGGNCEY